jgi:general secretion pathway protein K
MKSREDGMALLIAVWAIILIGAFVAGMVAMSGTDAAITANRIESARARHLANAGVQRGIAVLADPAARQKLTLGQAFSVQLDDDSSILVEVRDSCGAIDLNWAPHILLRAYGETMGMKPAAAERFADAIVARQQTVLSKQAGPLSAGPWQSLDQLADLPDIDKQTLDALRPGLTINCRETGADPCCALESVRQALSLSGVTGSPSHKLAYDIAAQARLASGTKVTVQAAIWLPREAGPPFYRVTEWGAR